MSSENDSFYDWVDMFSIGVLFSKNRERFLPSLTEILKKSKISDGLILFFYNYLNCSHYTFTESNTSYFKTLFFAEDKQSVIVQLLTDWYSVHKDAYWYDSHKSQNDTYCGYWCFEVPALLKIFRIDDSFCSNADYYPNDFV